jgi:hypothetical protein
MPLGVALASQSFLALKQRRLRATALRNQRARRCLRTAPSSSRQTPLGTPSPRSAHPASYR